LQAYTCRFASALKELGLRPEERISLLALPASSIFPVAACRSTSSSAIWSHSAPKPRFRIEGRRATCKYPRHIQRGVGNPARIATFALKAFAMTNFAFSNPSGGEVYVDKSNLTIDIRWTGGPPKPSAQNVSLSLVDLGPTKNPNPYGQVVLAITGNITEPSAGVGQCVWVVPSTFTFNQGHYYVVYIQNAPAPVTNWAYSQPFNIFAGATVTRPSGGLASSSNYIIGSADGAALQNPSVTITIMEDLVIAPGVANFGFQMNSYSTKNANNVPSNEYVAWQQYLIVPQFNTQSVTCGYQGYLAAPPQGPGGQLFNSGPLSLVPLKSATTIPKNWTFTLALKSAPNDPHWNIIEADLTAADSTATPPWSITTKCKLLNLTLNAGGPVTSANVAPICAFQLNIVGPSGGTSTAVFKSGGGNITYTAQNQITAFSSVPPCAEVNNPTAEISNVSYSQLPTGTHSTLVQSFSA
jgi:hypothetical protein